MPVATQAWRCTVCGYVHRGAEPPLQCPVCGAPRELFEPWNEPASEEHPTLSQGERGATAAALRVVIVGAGIAGVAAAESLRSAAPEAEITLVSKEAELPYYRLNLTRYLAGQLDPRALPIHPASWYHALA